MASWGPSRDGRIYTRAEIDAGPLLAYAADLTARSGERVTITHVAARLVALALREVPQFNARVVFGRIRPKDSIDVSLAVDIGSGHDLAPVLVRAADSKTATEIAAEIAHGAGHVRAGTHRGFATTSGWIRAVPWFVLRPALALASVWNGGLGLPALGQPGFPLGAAFVSNVGSLGLDEGYLAPLPLARCTLYVCLGAIRDRPAVVAGQVVPRPVMVLTATADHRIVDGAHAAQLATYLRAAFADPAAADAPAPLSEVR
ncbi:MAG: 2-oxo acid dehydrogenase acyltransferase [Actinomycetia bacterium]|nr:2-oxo acid dehydrogenase acyltransferase [Actinomycetes bacterium]